MKFNNTAVMNFEGAVIGMRNPKNSWDRSDSYFGIVDSYNNPGFEVVEAWVRQERPELYESDITIEQEKEKIDLEDKYDDWLFNNGVLRTCEEAADGISELAYLGPNDLTLMQNLIKAGSEHRKFMRQIFVSVDITAPLFYWKEFDTYKVGTVRNSCSTMHKIHVKEFNYDDFTHLGIDDCGLKDVFENYLKILENLRVQFNTTKDKKYWRALIEMLPDGFNMKATVTLDYENLLGMCSKGQRRFHKLNEWSGIDYSEEENFIQWARTLPYAGELLFLDELMDKNSN